MVELLAVVALVAAVVMLWPRSREQPPPYYADPVRTPGVLNPDVTEATLAATICVRGWTRTVRPASSYTGELKLRQMAEYGVGGSPRDYQEDHLISLGIGGHPTDPRNLWPEPLPHAEEVDSLERGLRLQVCDGSITLADAQRQIAEVKHESG